MNGLRYRLVIHAAALTLLLGAASAGLAQSSDNPGAAAAVPVPGGAARDAGAAKANQLSLMSTPSTFGTSGLTIRQIPAAAFRPRDGAHPLTYDSTGLVHSADGGQFWAPVFLDAGTKVTYVDLYGCDSNATFHFTVFLTGYSGSTTPATNDFLAFNSAQIGGSGCGYWIGDLTATPITINNNVEYGGGYHYVINAFFGTGDGSNKLKGADIWTYRQVSPAPGFATFTDVPVGSLYHRFVEALASSGITAGCGGGLFCPNTAVTRGQVAVFLAAALGLHFPN
jgi:hypothetical protein